MNTSKIIKGVVSNGRYTVTAPIIKEDYGLYLQIEGVELPETYQVDFSNDEHHGTSVTMIGNSDGVLIPHQFIDTGKDIFAFLYHVGANYGRTVFKFRIPNKLRPDRTDEQPTPEEQSVIDQAISALNTAVEQTAQDKTDADTSAQSASADADRAEQAKDDAVTFAQRSANSAQASADYSSSSQASATASANSASQSAQIKADVEDLVDDAQASADASERSASNAHTYATSAERSSVNASASESSAQGYASQAQTSANTASTKASEASISAQTASQKATESAQSASQALTYKTDAESAKTASQTAQGLAESARDDAISAKNDAESARDDAESARDEAVNAVASISGALDDKADVITDTASGSIASFPDGADGLPLKSLVVDIDPVQDLSNGDPSPENICPISGWTGCEVNATGKNLVSKTISGYQINASGVISANPNYDVQVGAVKTGESYTITNGNSNIVIAFYASEPSIGSAAYDGTRIVQTSHTFTAPINGFVAFRTNSGYSAPQIEVGTTATAYEPYTGRSITINLGQTVYGGKLDVLSGELVIDRAMVDLGTLKWESEDSEVSGLARVDVKNKGMLYYSSPICSKFRGVMPKGYKSVGESEICFSNSETFPLLRVRWSELSGKTNTEITAAFTGVQLCYELATPIEIQLSANQINSLLGVNNIFADTGDTACEYRADTKLYINKKIAEALASLT